MNKNQKNKIKITSINSSKLFATLALSGVILGTASYYNYEYKGELWCPAYVQADDLTILEDGELYYYFEPGKHFIEISRNDLFPHKFENVDGYEIRSVEVNSWRDNTSVIYVNTKPVMVKLTGSNEVFSYFDEFGIVVEDEEYSKILEKKKDYN